MQIHIVHHFLKLGQLRVYISEYAPVGVIQARAVRESGSCIAYELTTVVRMYLFIHTIYNIQHTSYI